jgi:probable addiction module antidote protein
MPKKSIGYQEILIESLKDPKEAAAYVEAAIEDGDPELLLVALRNVAKAHGGMTEVARKAHLNRESLYKTLSSKGNPKLKSLTSILDAFGLRLAVQSK